MNLVEVASNTIFYRAPDGRIVFRPWGARGPCYLLSEKQRLTRARIQLAYYATTLSIVAFCVGDIRNALLFGIVLPLLIGGNYVLYWLFSRGLGLTEPPAKPSPEYVKAQTQRNTEAFGRPLLWVMLIGSLAFVLGGVLVGALDGPLDTALESILFFGLCAFVFGRRLRK